MSKTTVRLRSLKTIEQDIKALPHQPGIYVVRVGGNGFGNGAVVYVGRSWSSIRGRWGQRLNAYHDREDNRDFRMMSDLATHLERNTRVTVEARPTTLRQFHGNKKEMIRRINHDEGMLIEHYENPRLNIKSERENIDPWLKLVDGFWRKVDRFLAMVGLGFFLALFVKLVFG